MDRQALIRRLEEIAGPQGVISERNQLRTYECDGLANFRVIPSVVVLPETAGQAQAAVRACHEKLNYMIFKKKLDLFLLKNIKYYN